MTEPSEAMLALQAALVAAWRADEALSALVPASRIGDVPQRSQEPEHVLIERHDVVTRDTDLTLGFEHRLRISVAVAQPSRAVLAQVLALVTAGATSVGSEAIAIPLARHVRTETFFDARSGHARARIELRFVTEPND
jgi:hypothetical protein